MASSDSLTQSTGVYDLEYFSGSQMFLYIGDVWVDEVTSLQYTRSQSKTPIYGYASQLYDDMAAGQVIVQGSFSINYKEQGYLWAVLRRWKNISLAEAMAGTDNIKNRTGLTEAEKALLKAGKRAPIVWNEEIGNHQAIQRQSLERVIQEKTTTAEAYKFYADLAGYSSYDSRMKGRARDTKFEDIMENFEDQVWRTDISNDNLKAMIRNPDNNVFDGFDIYVVFGNYASRGPNHTVQKIVNVSLTSQGKLVKIDGEPVQEVYEFLAQTTF